jgi:hypothetical protein
MKCCENVPRIFIDWLFKLKALMGPIGTEKCGKCNRS